MAGPFGVSASYLRQSASGRSVSSLIGVLLTPGALASVCVYSGLLTKAVTASAACGLMRYETRLGGTGRAPPYSPACSLAK